MEALRAERVWQETVKALATERPDVYFETLRAAARLKRIFPEVDALFGVPQPEQWHPEIDTGVHTLMALRHGGAIVAQRDRALRGARPRPRQSDDPQGTAAAHQGTSNAPGAARALVRALARAESFSRSRAARRAAPGTVHKAAELKPQTCCA